MESRSDIISAVRQIKIVVLILVVWRAVSLIFFLAPANISLPEFWHASKKAIATLFSNPALGRIISEDASGLLWQVFSLILAIAVLIGLYRESAWALRVYTAMLILYFIIFADNFLGFTLSDNILPLPNWIMLTFWGYLALTGFFLWSLSLAFKREVLVHYLTATQEN